MKKTILRILVACIAFGLCLFFILQSQNNKYEPISTQSIVDSFDNNIAECKSEYDGKRIEMSGLIDEIGIDDDDNIYIALHKWDEDLSSMLGESGVYIKCIVKNKKSKDVVSKLSEGDSVTVKGKCKITSDLIVMENCIVELH